MYNAPERRAPGQREHEKTCPRLSEGADTRVVFEEDIAYI